MYIPIHSQREKINFKSILKTNRGKCSMFTNRSGKIFGFKSLIKVFPEMEVISSEIRL
jgi:hypothetical protein